MSDGEQEDGKTSSVGVGRGVDEAWIGVGGSGQGKRNTELRLNCW